MNSNLFDKTGSCHLYKKNDTSNYIMTGCKLLCIVLCVGFVIYLVLYLTSFEENPDYPCFYTNNSKNNNFY